MRIIYKLTIGIIALTAITHNITAQEQLKTKASAEQFAKMNNAELFVFYDSFLDKLDLTTKELFRKHSLLSLHSISVNNSLRNIILQIAFSFWYLYLAKITKSKLGFLHTTLLEFVPYTMNVKQYPNDINELKEFANIDKYF